MTHELAALAACALIHVVIMAMAQQRLTRDAGVEKNTSPRDDMPELSRDTKRLRRALDNHVENIGLFITAVVLVQFTGQNSWFTALCAWTYVGARALYVPAYLYGWAPWRSLIFTLGLLATLTMIVAAVL